MGLLNEVKRVNKGWGNETWIYNEELCIKELFIIKGSSCSMHFHIKKEEIFWIKMGSVIFETIDTTTGKISEKIFHTGDYILVPRLTPHRFSATDGNATIVEFSTHHEDLDSYRVIPGDSQLVFNNENNTKE